MTGLLNNILKRIRRTSWKKAILLTVVVMLILGVLGMIFPNAGKLSPQGSPNIVYAEDDWSGDQPNLFDTALEDLESSGEAGFETAEQETTGDLAETKGGSILAQDNCGPLGIICDVTVFIAKLLFNIVSLIAHVVLVFINIFKGVAEYNDFGNATIVNRGWSMVRDISNMFLVIILLLISFGTVLKLQTYHWRTQLGKFVIFALLINFSKMIVLFFIDLGQVVMITFVDSFKDEFGRIFLQSFGFGELFSLGGAESVTEGFTAILTSIFALLFVSIILCVIVILTVILIFRIVILWLLVAISPLPFLLRIAPGRATSRADEYWTMFIKYVTVGPILVFFLWLSLAVMSTPLSDEGGGTATEIVNKVDETVQGVSGTDMGIVNSVITKFGRGTTMMSFVMSGALIFASMMMAQQFSVVGGQMAGNFSTKLKSSGFFLKNPATNFIGRKVSRGYKETLTGDTWLGKRLRGTDKKPNRLGRLATDALKLTTKSGRAGMEARRDELMQAADKQLEGDAHQAANYYFTKGPAYLKHPFKAMTKKGRKELEQQVVRIPHSDLARQANLQEKVKMYSGMTKEERAASASKVWKLGGAEGRMHRQALVLSAQGEGQVDDLMTYNKQFANSYHKLGVSRYRYDKKKGIYHDDILLGNFLADFMEGKDAGEVDDDNVSEGTKDTLLRLEEAGKKNLHHESIGHATTDTATGNKVLNQADYTLTNDDGRLINKFGEEIQIDDNGNLVGKGEKGSGTGTVIGKDNKLILDKGSNSWAMEYKYKDADGKEKTKRIDELSDEVIQQFMWGSRGQNELAIGEANKRIGGRIKNNANIHEDKSLAGTYDEATDSLIMGDKGAVEARWVTNPTAMQYQKYQSMGGETTQEIAHTPGRNKEAKAPGVFDEKQSALVLHDKDEYETHQIGVTANVRHHVDVTGLKFGTARGELGQHRFVRLDATKVEGVGRIQYIDTAQQKIVEQSIVDAVGNEIEEKLQAAKSSGDKNAEIALEGEKKKLIYMSKAEKADKGIKDDDEGSEEEGST